MEARRESQERTEEALSRLSYEEKAVFQADESRVFLEVHKALYGQEASPIADSAKPSPDSHTPPPRT